MSNFKFQLSLDIKPYSEALKSAIRLAQIGSKDINNILQGVKTELNTDEFDKELKLLESKLKAVDDDIEIDVKLDSNDAKKAIKSVTKEVEKSQSFLKKYGGTLSNVGFSLQGLQAIYQTLQSVIRSTVGAAEIQEKAETKVEQAVKQTGMTAGYTADQLKNMASELQNLTVFGDEDIMNNVTAQMLTFTNVTGDQFAQAQIAVLDLATVLDGDLKSASIQLGKALNDPIANLSALSRSGIQFTAEQKEMVKSLWEAGKQAEAQSIILEELNRQYGGQAQAMAGTYSGAIQQFKNAWGDLNETFGKAILPMLANMAKGLKNVIETTDSFLKSLGFIRSKSELLREELGKEISVFNALSREIELLSQKEKLNNDEKERYAEILKDMNSKYSAYLPNLVTEKDTYSDLATTIKSAKTELMELVQLKVVNSMIGDLTNQMEDLTGKLQEVEVNMEAWKLEQIQDVSVNIDLSTADNLSTALEKMQSAFANETLREVPGLFGLMEQSAYNVEEAMRQIPEQYRLTKDEAKAIAETGSIASEFANKLHSNLVLQESVEQNINDLWERKNILVDEYGDKIKEIAQSNNSTENTTTNSTTNTVQTSETHSISYDVDLDFTDAEQALSNFETDVEESIDKEIQANVDALEKHLSDKDKYYQTVKFKDANYFDWMISQYNGEVDQMDLFNSEKKAMKDQFFEKLKQQQASYYDNVKFKDENYFNYMIEQHNKEVDAQEGSDEEKKIEKQQFYDNLTQQHQDYIDGIDSENEGQLEKDIERSEKIAQAMTEAYDEFFLNKEERSLASIELDQEMNETNYQLRMQQLDEEQKKEKKGSLAWKKIQLEKKKLEQDYANTKKKLREEEERANMSLADKGIAVLKAGIKEAIMMLAKRAMSAAMMSVFESVPFPANLIAAPIAGATAYAGVSAIASGFEDGGKIKDEDLLKNSPLIPQNEDGLIAVQKEEIVVSNKRDKENDDLILDMNKGKSRKQIEMDILQKHIGEIQAMNDGGFVGQNPIKTFFNVDIPQLQTPVTNFIMQNTESPLLKEIAENLGLIKEKIGKERDNLPQSLLAQEGSEKAENAVISSESSTRNLSPSKQGFTARVNQEEGIIISTEEKTILNTLVSLIQKENTVTLSDSERIVSKSDNTNTTNSTVISTDPVILSLSKDKTEGNPLPLINNQNPNELRVYNPKVEALLQAILDKKLEANTSIELELDGEQIAEVVTKYQAEEQETYV